ncbi:hypothetical protein SCALM49S_02470 [Streptomyces californicus]
MGAGEFEALDAFLDDVLELPVTGKDGVERVYRIEDPAAVDGVKIEKIATLAARMVAGGARSSPRPWTTRRSWTSTRCTSATSTTSS